MDIAEKTLKGFAWIGLAKIIQQSITWVITITLARILLPSDYGLMAMANLTVYFMNFFNELSIGAAIVQGKELNDSYLKNAFTFVFFMSICMYFLLYFSSPFIGSFFNQAGLADILKLLGFNFVICAFWLLPALVFGAWFMVSCYVISPSQSCSLIFIHGNLDLDFL